MRSLRLSFYLVTPAFVSTADQNKAELGAQAIKGVLRWWWRALPEHAKLRLPDLRKQEASLFGSAWKDIRLRSPVTISLDCRKASVRDQGELPYSCGQKVKAGKFEIDALHYLAYGPVATVGKREKDQRGRAYNPKFNDSSGMAKRGLLLKRPALEPGSVFSLRLSWREGSLDENQEHELIRALAAWLELGGIGSRSRKGWGSVALQELEIAEEELRHEFEKSSQSFRHWQNQSFGEGNPTTWPSLAQFRVLETIQAREWGEALGKLGQKYKSLRPSSRSAERWIAGSASPRRASSIILKVRPSESAAQQLEGVLGVFVCYKDNATSGAQDWGRFFQSLSWTRIGRR